MTQKIRLSDLDKADTVDRYSKRYREFGYSPKALGWDKGKQDIRFDVLTSLYNCKDKTILDIGCGFGDMNKTLMARCPDQYRYIGIDLVPELIHEARQRYANDSVRFIEGDFMAVDIDEAPNFAIASGTFNHKLKNTDNYALIEAAMSRAFTLCSDGFAFDFLSDKVDYPLTHTFHAAPERILSLAYQFSRNVVLRNDYMPFEFSMFVFKDASFLAEDTVFNRHKELRG